MAYVVSRSTGAWEIRESRATPAGPRSRTLATFRVLTPDVVDRASARSSQQLDPHDLYSAARRIGAPVEASTSDRAAGELLAEIAAGRRPRLPLVRLLTDALRADGREPTSNAQAAGAWVSASPRRRGETLRDLLLLVDYLPRSRAPERGRFPRIASGGA